MQRSKKSVSSSKFSFKDWRVKHKKIFSIGASVLYLIVVVLLDIPLTMLFRYANDAFIGAWSYFRWFILLGAIPVYKFAKTFCD